MDYDWFPLPPIDQEGTLFAGEFTVVGSNRAEVVDFLERFIDVPVQCEMGGVVGSSRISPNVNVGPDCYANEILALTGVRLRMKQVDEHVGEFVVCDARGRDVSLEPHWRRGHLVVVFFRGGMCSSCDLTLHRWRAHLDQLAWFGFVEMLLFVGTVAVAYAYVWRRGGLEWD